MKLLEESKGVPIIFAVMTNTGHILLEEYTDALQSLQWNNPVAMSMEHLLDSDSDDEDCDEEPGEPSNTMKVEVGSHE